MASSRKSRKGTEIKFSVSHADESEFTHDGLRTFFEYRDLAIKEATAGRFNAPVIRARSGERSPGEWHQHDLDFQMIYVLRGWVRFEYEGVGEVLLRRGSCVHQPPGIRHREVEHSDDLEMLEITSPAVFETEAVEALPS